MQGRCFLSRLAEDCVIGCEVAAEARKLMAVLPQRFPRVGLRMQPTKPAVIACRQPEAHQGANAGNGTCTVLGLPHSWTPARRGFWVSKRRTARKRLCRTKTALWRWCRANRHAPLHSQSQRLCLQLRGHVRYDGIRGNVRLVEAVRRDAEKTWQYGLSRRSSTRAIRWEKFQKVLATDVLPIPQIVHNI